MVLAEMVYGVCHQTEPTSFRDALSEPDSKEWMEAIPSEEFPLGFTVVHDSKEVVKLSLKIASSHFQAPIISV